MTSIKRASNRQKILERAAACSRPTPAPQTSLDSTSRVALEERRENAFRT